MLYSNPRINRVKNVRSVTVMIIVLGLLALRGEFASGKDAVTVEGKVSGGLESGERMGRSDYSGKVKLKSKRNDLGVRAVLAARGEARKSQVTLTDAYVDAILTEASNLRFGVMERKFGLSSQKDGWTHEPHSELARKLKGFGFEARALQFKLVHADGERTEIDFALGHNNALDVFVTTRVEYLLVEDWLTFGAWGLLQSDRIDNGFQKIAAASVALWSDHAQWRYALEIMAGKDPERSEFEWLYGHKRSVYFGAATLKLGYAFELSNRLNIAPIFGLAYINADTVRDNRNTLERQAALVAELGEGLAAGFHFYQISRNRSVTELLSNDDDRRYSFEVSYEF
jgi:hypothetical protein